MRSGPDEETPGSARRLEPLQINRPSTSTSYTSTGQLQQPLTPGGSVGRFEPLRRPTGNLNSANDDEDQKVNNATAAILQTKEVYSGHDALNLLFEAAGRNGDIDHHRTGSSGSVPRPIMGTGNTPGSQNSFPSPQANSIRGMDGRNQIRSAQEPAVDPEITRSYMNGEGATDEASFAEAVKAWSRFRFVRAGWLTAKEAIAYIDYFYTYLSPLTPIVVPDYRDHSTHAKLLKEEPMLVVTLLTISCRYARLSGAGAISRPYAIHEKLWSYLQGMIDRMIWGQEQFGGGFCGAGQQPGSDVNPLSRKGLRTLGTVESLMLLTEWHPRALHFPPGDDDAELMAPEESSLDPNGGGAGNGVSPDLCKGVGGQRIDSWLEPCWRSDRMCWMLLGNAMALAFEIGVFDETSEVEFEQANQSLPHSTVKAYFRRKNHLKDLLIIYVTQTSGRLGLTSMLPKVERENAPLKSPNQLYQERMAEIRRQPQMNRNDAQRQPYESVATQTRHVVQDLVLDFWQRIAKIMEMGNHQMFPNRRQTRDIIKSGRYEELLRYFQTPLKDWKRGLEQAQQIPAQLRHILTIEYEYCRVYLNSLALQAVVERCTHNTPMQNHLQPPNGGSSSAPKDGGAIPFSTLVKWYGNDRYYIKEVIDASRNVLKVVVDGLYPGDYLKHAPVRTFFRIVSVAIILLKTFALGATEDDVAISLGLMDRAVNALRTSIVDDVHVGNRFADLLDTLTNRIRSRFVRMAANGSNGISRAPSHSPPRTDHNTPMMPPPHQAHPPSGGHMNAQWPSVASYGHQGLHNTSSPSLGVNAGGRATPNHPLYGISTETYDPGTNNISIMPPPDFGPNGYDFTGATGTGAQFGAATPGLGGDGTADGYMPDWLALPLDPLLNNYGADVTQTTFGPDVGGYDLLDVLLSMEGSA